MDPSDGCTRFDTLDLDVREAVIDGKSVKVSESETRPSRVYF